MSALRPLLAAADAVRLPLEAAAGAVYRARDASEYLADAAVHVVGVACGIAGAAILFATLDLQADSTLRAAETIYAITLVAMLTCSALYNTLKPPRPHSWLRRADHAAIFLMIAGTCTPFALHGAPEWRLAALVLLWSVALAGAVLKLFAPGRFERPMLYLYIALTWMGLASLSGELGALPGASAWLLCGGVAFYSIGIVFHLWDRLRFSTAIWHGLVLIAAGCHYWAIMTGVALPQALGG